MDLYVKVILEDGSSCTVKPELDREAVVAGIEVGLQGSTLVMPVMRVPMAMHGKDIRTLHTICTQGNPDEIRTVGA